MTPQERLAISRVGAARAQAQLDVGRETAEQLAGAIEHFKDEPEEVVVAFLSAFVRVVAAQIPAGERAAAAAATLETFVPGLDPARRARILGRL
jgi:hypothetical protein